MKLQFSHLYLQNFMSFKEADLDLSSKGFALVVGENRNNSDGASSNGSGKSTIFEAIYWCLTGVTLRGSKDVVNKSFESDGCYVKLDFYADDKIVELLRSKNHKKYKTNLLITVNGNDISAKGIRDSEKVFAQTFPELTSDLIGSVIILGQGLPNRFTGNTPSGRKQVLEQLTNSDFMIESLKYRILSREQELKSEYTNKSLEASNLNGQIQVINSQINDLNLKKMNSNKDSLIAMFNSKKAELDNLSNSINSTLNIISDSKSQLSDIYSKIADKKEAISSLQSYKSIDVQNVEKKYNPSVIEVNSEISSLTAYISKAELIKDICPTCGQKLVGVEKIDCSNEKHKLVLAKENKTRINTEKQNEISEINSKYEFKILEETRELNNFKTAYNDLDVGTKRLENQLLVDQNKEKQLKSEVESIDLQIKAIDLVDYDSQIESLKNKLSELNDSLMYNNKELEDIASHQIVIQKFQTFIKRDFRGYLLEQYISFLNSTAKKYCSSLFNSSDINIYLDGNNLSIDYSNKEYESLSGGEKQKVDVLIQLSIREMLRSSLNFSSNILVLDEITDNLDAEGCQKLIDFISTSLYDVDSIYLISHRKDLDIPYDYVLNVVKNESGISELN